MDFRVILLCFVTAYGKTPGNNSYYKANVGLVTGDARGQPSDTNKGFVTPLDFSSFTRQFEGEESRQDLPFRNVKPAPDFGTETKTGVFQNSEPANFPGSSFQAEAKHTKTGFVHPVQFISPFDKDGSSSKVYKTNIKPAPVKPKHDSDHLATTATGDDDDYDYEGTYHKEIPKVKGYRHSVRSYKPNKYYSSGKSSYPPPKKNEHAEEFYDSTVKMPDEVEMILPKDRVLFLPLANGQPKPYEGYRAAPVGESYKHIPKKRESIEQREKRLSEGEIIYGKPRVAIPPLNRRQSKRSPAEYYGGIYPYYDYSDSTLSVSGETDPDSRGKKSSASTQKKKKAYPKKHYHQIGREKPYNPYKYPKENTRRRKDEDDSHGFASDSLEEADEDEEPEETKGDKPLYKYTYDNTFSIPQLEIKTYPYEKQIRDSKVEGSRADESFEVDDSVDEYTAGYERYIKTLPADLESYFGTPDIEKYTVEATQNLENNKNCKKIEAAPAKQEGEGEKKEEAETQVCYACSDPKTGDNYEQCAYKSQPKSQKYFFGGTTSSSSNDTAEPITYRYKRSTYDTHFGLDPYQDKEVTKREDGDGIIDFFKLPKSKSKKKYKKQKASSSNLYGKKYPKSRYNPQYNPKYDPFFNLEEASSTKQGRTLSIEEPPKSYDGPGYTYEGPEETYEGPSQTYEGPKETYEGPAEPYEGPINQEYYDNTDERLEDDEEESTKQQYQLSNPPNREYASDEYYRPKPIKRQSFSPSYSSSFHAPKFSGEDFGPTRYISDYRFGPEHFIDEEEPEGSKQSEDVKPVREDSATQKRGPHTFPNPEAKSEIKSPAASDNQEKEEQIGEAKVFKNGDVCQKKRKEGLICMVCKNEKTQATYEQCQYSTKPKEKYYAYGSQKSYTTKNPSESKNEDLSSDLYPEKSDIVEKKILIKTQSKVFGSEPPPTEGLAVAESRLSHSPTLFTDLTGDFSENVETYADDANQNDTNSRDFTESIERIEPRDGIEGLEEYLYDVGDSDKKATEDEKQSYKSYDDYFYDLFPDFGKQENAEEKEGEEREESESEKHLTFDPFANIRQFHEENADGPKEYVEEEEEDAEASRPEELRLKDQESRIPSDFFLPYNEENHKKDLEKALGEFQSKDWSNCKKIVKKKLTCYQCVDKNGVNNEECMYVEASQPISKLLAYHERKELQPAGQQTVNKTIEPLTDTTESEKSDKSLKRYRKDKNSPSEAKELIDEAGQVEYIDVKGDLEGTRKPSFKEEEETQPDTEQEEQGPKRKAKKPKKNPKKRNKTTRNETTTERIEKIRKRKFPVKKFEGEELPVDTKPENEGTYGLKNAEAEKQNPTTTTNSS